MTEQSPRATRFIHRQVDVTGGGIHVVEAGSGGSPAVLFLHGWPQSWLEFERVMAILGGEMHVVALDLPGIGGSTYRNAPGDKRAIAAVVHEVIAAIGLTGATLVGHDIGGQVAFAYLVAYPDELSGVVLVDMAVPGVDPWGEVIGNPKVWHLAFHGILDLPETMVRGRERAYFDHFYEAVNAHPEAIDDDARSRYVEAYRAPGALTTGFGWYRGFRHDAVDNAAFAAGGRRIATPMLYVRGDRSGGDMARYLGGFREAGIETVTGVIVPDCGHFVFEEQPDAAARLISLFARSCSR